MENTNNNSKWVADPSHSELAFKVKHLMISNVKGEFKKFKVEIDNADFTKGKVKVDSSLSVEDIYKKIIICNILFKHKIANLCCCND